MTTLKLFLAILLAVFGQLAVFGLVLLVRRWQVYRQLKQQCYGAVPAATLVSTTSWQDWRPLRVQRKVFEDAAHSVCSFYLEPADDYSLPAYRPGQYLTFRFSVAVPAAGSVATEMRPAIRCYSLSDKPGQRYYRITVKKVQPAGLVSGHLHDQVSEGDMLEVKSPAGHFYWSPEVEEPIVLIAGGIGITPVLSMLYSLLEHDPDHETWFFYGVRNGAEHLFKSELQDLAVSHPSLKLKVCYSRADETDVRDRDYQFDGRVDISLLRQVLPLKSFRFYICGPKAMMESLVPALESWGVPDHQVHYEAFGPATINRPSSTRSIASSVAAEKAGKALTVRFSQSGKLVQWDDRYSSLLELAERNGIKPDFGCRAGSCGSCQTVIESGEVHYNQEPDADVPAGACLLCISRPETDLTLAG